MNIVLVRHGRPDEAAEDRPHDPPLAAEGRVQAEAVAEHLAREGVARVISSPLLRARETAEPLARRTGLAVQVVEGWAEADRHLPRYRSAETLKALGSAEWRRFLADPLAFLGRDAEDFRGAVLAALEQLRTAGSGDVAVFTHGLVINQILSHILGLQGIAHFQPAYGSLTRVRVRTSGGLAVLTINERGLHAAAASTRAIAS